MMAVPGDPENNIEKIKEWTKNAIEQDIELLLFPEMSISGYWPDSELYYVAEPRDGESVSNLIEFLKGLDKDIAIVVGLAEDYGGAIYNTQLILTKEGILGYYRKTHWPHAEMGTWSCGDRYPIFEYKGVKIGIAICYDNNFPEVHRIYGLKGAHLVLSPYAYGEKFDPEKPETIKKSIFKWKDRERTLLRAAAMTNYTWHVACVGAGHVKDYKNAHESYFPGVLLIIAPDGKVVAETPDDSIEERIISYTISTLTNTEQRRGTNNFFKNRRTITYSRITEIP